MQNKEVIKELLKKHKLNFSETQEKVFINHLESFVDRIEKHLDVGLELNNDLRAQISSTIWEKTNTFIADFLTQINFKTDFVIPETEIFLIATHLALL